MYLHGFQWWPLLCNLMDIVNKQHPSPNTHTKCIDFVVVDSKLEVKITEKYSHIKMVSCVTYGKFFKLWYKESTYVATIFSCDLITYKWQVICNTSCITLRTRLTPLQFIMTLHWHHRAATLPNEKHKENPIFSITNTHKLQNAEF